MKEVFASIIHERCLLMARAESIALCQCPELGEDIYSCWIERMDASNPHDFDITDYINELANRYKVSQTQVSELFESIRLIIFQYDNLIDSV